MNIKDKVQLFKGHVFHNDQYNREYLSRGNFLKLINCTDLGELTMHESHLIRQIQQCGHIQTFYDHNTGALVAGDKYCDKYGHDTTLKDLVNRRVPDAKCISYYENKIKTMKHLSQLKQEEQKQHAAANKKTKKQRNTEQKEKVFRDKWQDLFDFDNLL